MKDNDSGEEFLFVQSEPILIDTPDENTDPIDSIGITFPQQGDITDTKIVAEVRKMLKGVDVSDVDGTATALDTKEKLGMWFTASVDGIRNLKKELTRDDLQRSAAAMAQFWYVASVIDKALDMGSYGSDTVGSLAKQASVSASYIYSIRLVAKRLTLQLAYLLGARMLSSTDLRRLSHVSDDALRQNIIKAFLESSTNTSDMKGIRTARAKMLDSAKSSGTGDNAVDAEDVREGVEPEFPEVENAIQAMKNGIKNLKPFAGMEPVGILRDAMDCCFVSGSMPNAEKVCTELRDLAGRLVEEIGKATAHLGDLLVSAQSIEQGLEVTESEEDVPPKVGKAKVKAK